MVFRAGFDVGVLHDPGILQQRERPVYRRHVHLGHAPLDPTSDGLRRNVTVRAENLGHDRLTLRRDAAPALAQRVHDVV
jgi:hypothetical protein